MNLDSGAEEIEQLHRGVQLAQADNNIGISRPLGGKMAQDRRNPGVGSSRASGFSLAGETTTLYG